LPGAVYGAADVVLFAALEGIVSSAKLTLDEAISFSDTIARVRFGTEPFEATIIELDLRLSGAKALCETHGTPSLRNLPNRERRLTPLRHAISETPHCRETSTRTPKGEMAARTAGHSGHSATDDQRRGRVLSAVAAREAQQNVSAIVTEKICAPMRSATRS
jgi:hypothetical protein